MIMYIIAVRDNAVETYMQPSFVAHNGAAIRAFMDHCKNPESDFAKHPEDYDLFSLGEFDDSTGLFSPPFGGQPIRLMRAIDSIVKV